MNSRFPEAFDTTVDPQFAGSLHYRKVVNCGEKPMDTTSVAIQIITSQSEDSVFVLLSRTSLIAHPHSRQWSTSTPYVKKNTHLRLPRRLGLLSSKRG